MQLKGKKADRRLGSGETGGSVGCKIRGIGSGEVGGSIECRIKGIGSGETGGSVGSQKKEKRLKRGIPAKIMIYGIISAVLFCVLWLLTFPVRESEKSCSPQIVVLGDSIFGQVRDDSAVSEKLSLLTGQEVFNGAMGGTCLSRIDATGRMSYTKDSLAFAAISQAISLDDFGLQQTAYIKESATEYFPEVIDTLEAIDFSHVEILLVQYGINDYHAGVSLDNPEDPYDEYTFGGALRSGLKDLRKAYPNLRIILLTSTYSWYEFSGMTCEEKDEGGGILEDYVNKELEIAEEMEVEVLDLYHDLYPHEVWEDWQIYTRDGLHPNEAGRQLLAETIAAYLGNVRK